MAKLITWNCNMAFRKKKDRILQYDPDIIVIQECENPDTNGDWSEFTDWRWIGENKHKGLGVFSRNGLSLQPTGVDGQGGELTIPVKTDGAGKVLGVWALNDKRNPQNRYIGQVYRTVRAFREFIDANTALLGDFNWNRPWDDSPKSPLCGDFSDTVDLLNSRGLKSVYHSLNDSDFGSEADPTFFMHKKQDRDYHIDYVFLPKTVIESVTSFSVGKYDDWIDGSDHMPIVVEL